MTEPSSNAKPPRPGVEAFCALVDKALAMTPEERRKQIAELTKGDSKERHT